MNYETKIQVAFGALFLVCGLTVALRHHYVVSRWSKTNATIISTNSSRPIYEYRVGGQRYTGNASTNDSYEPKFGDLVRIRFDPARPERSSDTDAMHALLGWACVGAGIILLSVG
jgi:hypothetical protein